MGEVARDVDDQVGARDVGRHVQVEGLHGGAGDRHDDAVRDVQARHVGVVKHRGERLGLAVGPGPEVARSLRPHGHEVEHRRRGVGRHRPGRDAAAAVVAPLGLEGVGPVDLEGAGRVGGERAAGHAGVDDPAGGHRHEEEVGVAVAERLAQPAHPSRTGRRGLGEGRVDEARGVLAVEGVPELGVREGGGEPPRVPGHHVLAHRPHQAPLYVLGDQPLHVLLQGLPLSLSLGLQSRGRLRSRGQGRGGQGSGRAARQAERGQEGSSLLGKLFHRRLPRSRSFNWG